MKDETKTWLKYANENLRSAEPKMNVTYWIPFIFLPNTLWVVFCLILNLIWTYARSASPLPGGLSNQ